MFAWPSVEVKYEIEVSSYEIVSNGKVCPLRYMAAPALALSASLPTLLPGGIFPKAEPEEVWECVLRPGSAHRAALPG